MTRYQMTLDELRAFIRESNHIEGIRRPVRSAEVKAYDKFLRTPWVTVGLLEDFVKAVQSDAVLRDRDGMNVRIGNYRPPRGGPNIRKELELLLSFTNSNMLGICTHCRTPAGQCAYLLHTRYEALHPFTDGNGRSGRALWLWLLLDAPLGFLHEWYYQSLSHSV